MLAIVYLISIYADPWMGRGLWSLVLACTTLFVLFLSWDLVESWSTLTPKERRKQLWLILWI